jgi:hypothetical protein
MAAKRALHQKSEQTYKIFAVSSLGTLLPPNARMLFLAVRY